MKRPAPTVHQSSIAVLGVLSSSLSSFVKHSYITVAIMGRRGGKKVLGSLPYGSALSIKFLPPVQRESN